MPSADFRRSIAPPYDGNSTWQIDRPPRVMRIHLHANAHRIYDSAFRMGAGKRLAFSPGASASYAIPVRQTGALPAASFRFHLTMDTLAVRLAVPPHWACRRLSLPSKRSMPVAREQDGPANRPVLACLRPRSCYGQKGVAALILRMPSLATTRQYSMSRVMKKLSKMPSSLVSTGIKQKPI